MSDLLAEVSDKLPIFDLGDRVTESQSHRATEKKPYLCGSASRWRKIPGALRAARVPARRAPIAYRFSSDRMKIRPCATAGEARHSSFSAFRARTTQLRPASTTTVSPSSFRRYTLPSAPTGDAEKLPPIL